MLERKSLSDFALVQAFARIVLGVRPAIRAGAHGGLHALLVADEAAIPGTASAVPIDAPRVVLRLGAGAERGDGRDNSEREDCDFHCGLLGCSESPP